VHADNRKRDSVVLRGCCRGEFEILSRLAHLPSNCSFCLSSTYVAIPSFVDDPRTITSTDNSL